MNSVVGEAVPAVKGNQFVHSPAASESSGKPLLAERRGVDEWPLALPNVCTWLLYKNYALEKGLR